MIRRSTLITLIVFLLLVGAAYGLKRYQKAHPKAGTPTPTPEATAADFKIDDILEVSITSKDSQVLVRRKDSKSPWEVVVPPGKAEQGKIDTALYNLVTLTVLNTPEETDLKVLGLDKPQYVVRVRLKGGKTWMMEIGKQTPIESGYYVKVGDKIMVIDSYPIEGLIDLLKNPPIVTPTPTKTPKGAKPTPTSTPTPTPEATATPTPTPTATTSPTAAQTPAPTPTP